MVGGSRVGTASGRAGHGLPWQPQIARQLAGGGGGRMGGREGSKLGTAPRESFFSIPPPPTCPQFLGKHPSSHMPLLITLVHCWPLPQAYPLGPDSFSLPTPQQTGVFRALSTRLSPGSLHTCISSFPSFLS